MADVQVLSSPFTIGFGTINANANYELGTGDVELPSTIIVQFVGTGFTGTIIPKSKSMGQRNGAAPYTPVPYVPRCLAGVAQTDVVATATLTNDFTIKIDATGLAISLEVTIAAGTGVFYWSAVAGPAA